MRSLPALEAIGRSDLSRKRLKTASQGVDSTAAMAVYATVESNRRRLRRCSTAGRHGGTCTSLERPGQAFMPVANGWPSETEQHCFVAPVWTALRVRSSVPLRARHGAVHPSSVNVAERRDCPCACFLRASPSKRRGPSRHPLRAASLALATRCGVRSRRARMRIARVVTASDVRAHRHRLCVYAASRRVIEGSNPRDGLFEGHHAISARSATPVAE